MRRKSTNVILAIGIILLAGAVGLYGFRVISAHNAAGRSEKVMSQMAEMIPDYDENDPAATGLSDDPLAEIEIGGVSFIGYLRFERQGTKIPVATDEYDGKGFAYNVKGSPSSKPFMIGGYDNDGALGVLDEIEPGDDITFVDVNGTRLRYKVTGLGSIKSSDDTDDIKEDMVLYTGISRNVMRALFAVEQE